MSSTLRLVREVVGYARAQRKLWLLPILLALLIVGVLVLLSELGPLSPFIYPLF